MVSQGCESMAFFCFITFAIVLNILAGNFNKDLLPSPETSIPCEPKIMSLVPYQSYYNFGPGNTAGYSKDPVLNLKNYLENHVEISACPKNYTLKDPYVISMPCYGANMCWLHYAWCVKM